MSTWVFAHGHPRSRPAPHTHGPSDLPPPAQGKAQGHENLGFGSGARAHQGTEKQKSATRIQSVARGRSGRRKADAKKKVSDPKCPAYPAGALLRVPLPVL